MSTANVTGTATIAAVRNSQMARIAKIAPVNHTPVLDMPGIANFRGGRFSMKGTPSALANFAVSPKRCLGGLCSGASMGADVPADIDRHSKKPDSSVNPIAPGALNGGV